MREVENMEIQTAINLLKRMRPNECESCLLVAITNECDSDCVNPKHRKAIDMAISALEYRQAPTITPRRGKWLPVTNGRGGHECSACRNYAPSFQNGREHLSVFCPWCSACMSGADMGREG